MTKVESGYLYDTDFAGISTEWDINDFSRISLDNGLVIRKGNEPFFMFLPLLTEEKKFVLDIKNVYNPTLPNEMGGIVIYANEDDYICLEEYFDPVKGIVNTYPWLRLVRNHNVYSGYWSNDGLNWNLVGVNNFGELSPKIGLFLEGSQFDMKVEYLRAFKSPYIEIHNPPSGDVELVGEHNVLNSMPVKTFIPKLAFPVSQYGLPFEGKFRWGDGEDTVETEFMRNLWGGDVFKFQISLDLYYFNNEWIRVETNEEEFLGHLNTIGGGVSLDRNVIRMKLRNPLSYSFNDVIVALEEYKDVNYRDYVGLSLDNTTFSHSVDIGSVGANDEIEFYLEIKRGTVSLEEVFFALKVFSQVGG